MKTADPISPFANSKSFPVPAAVLAALGITFRSYRKATAHACHALNQFVPDLLRVACVDNLPFGTRIDSLADPIAAEIRVWDATPAEQDRIEKAMDHAGIFADAFKLANVRMGEGYPLPTEPGYMVLVPAGPDAGPARVAVPIAGFAAGLPRDLGDVFGLGSRRGCDAGSLGDACRVAGQIQSALTTGAAKIVPSVGGGMALVIPDLDPEPGPAPTFDPHDSVAAVYAATSAQWAADNPNDPLPYSDQWPVADPGAVPEPGPTIPDAPAPEPIPDASTGPIPPPAPEPEPEPAPGTGQDPAPRVCCYRSVPMADVVIRALGLIPASFGGSEARDNGVVRRFTHAVAGLAGVVMNYGFQIREDTDGEFSVQLDYGNITEADFAKVVRLIDLIRDVCQVLEDSRSTEWALQV